jgi:hypothetical protein
MSAHKQGARAISAAVIAKFVKDHKRLQVALAGYSVVAVFVLSYLIANQIQNWFGRSSLPQFTALVFALLIAAPLALALAKIKTAIGQEQAEELVEVNLGDGNFWWSTRLYLLAALAEDYTNIRQLVFLRNYAGRERGFIGIATPTATRRALANQHPALEKAYRVAYRYSLDDPSGQIKTLAPEDEAEKVVQGLMVGSEGGNILQAAGGENALKQYVEESLLRKWLGRDLITQSIECKDSDCEDQSLKPLLLYRITECSAPFVALVQNQQLKGMVDRLKIAARVADTSLRQQLQ